MLKTAQTKETLGYIIVFLAICISGNPIIMNVSEWLYIIGAILLAVVTLIKHKALVSEKFIKWLFLVIALFILQGFFLSSVSVPADINFIAKIYVAFSVSVITGYSFRHIYFNLIYYISLISLIFYALNLLGIYPGVEFDRYKSIIIYNAVIGGEEFPRNAGMFWEAGAFQGYILLAFLLYLDCWTALIKQNKFKCTVLFLAIVTTQSTTGYVVLMVLTLYLLLQSHINRILKSIIIAVSFVGIIIAFTQLDFLGDKIVEQYQNAIALERGEVSWSRFGALMIDLENIANHPIIGNGFLMSEKYVGMGNDMAGSGNGFSGAINTFGLPFILLYFIVLYRNLKGFQTTHRLAIIFIIILLLNGEFYLNYPLFWALMFIRLPRKNEKNWGIINRTQSTRCYSTVSPQSCKAAIDR